MTGFMMFLHVLVCILIALVVLMQAGRGGGLTEHFASAESMFGAHTNEFMIKATSILSTVFFITCISLAVLSSKKGKSLMSDRVTVPVDEVVPSLPSEKEVNDALIPVAPQSPASTASEAPETEGQAAPAAPEVAPDAAAGEKMPAAQEAAPATK